MEKKGKSSSSSPARARVVGGVERKKPMKKSNKHQHRLLKKVVDYLKSDSYLYAPLFSSRLISKHIPLIPGKGIETELSSGYGENGSQKKKLVENVVDYLKCDCYMYAPLLNTTQAQQSTVSTRTIKPPTPTPTAATEKVRYSPQKGAGEGAGKPAVERTRPLTPTKEREGKIREDKDNLSLSVSPRARSLVRKTVAYTETVKLHHNCRLPGTLHEKETRGSCGLNKEG